MFKSKQKKLLSICLSMALISSVVFSVHAEQGNVRYSFNQETSELTISGEGKMDNYDLDNLQPWTVYKNAIKSIKIEEGVTSIGNRAFVVCIGLTSITIPGSVAKISNRAFWDCSGLRAITYLGKTDPADDNCVFPGCCIMELNVPSDYEGDTFCIIKVDFVKIMLKK